jgi:hypothetical protein
MIKKLSKQLISMRSRKACHKFLYIDYWKTKLANQEGSMTSQVVWLASSYEMPLPLLSPAPRIL